MGMTASTKPSPLLAFAIAAALGAGSSMATAAGQDAAQQQRPAQQHQQHQQAQSPTQRPMQPMHRAGAPMQHMQHMHDQGGQDIADARREGIIWSTFATNPNLRETGIEVEVKRGVAIISGTVESRVERELAEELARNVEGITRVDNRIDVDPLRRPLAQDTVGGTATLHDRDRDRIDDRRGDRDFGTVVSDATTTAQVKSKLLWNRHTSGMDIDVDTWRGHVTLSGVVDSNAERQLAEQLARNTGNVVRVDNRLEVVRDAVTGVAPTARTTADARGPQGITAIPPDRSGVPGQPVNDKWITDQVSNALLYSDSVDAMAVEVESDNGKVRLSGAVATREAHREAIELAQAVRGVRDVDARGLAVDPDRALAAAADEDLD
jgi:osmotically-inducible protein OsmY